MKNNIIEKLGLDNLNGRKKIQGFGEKMLEALIFCLDEKERKVDNFKTEEYVISVIEKATGKLWQEIKELLNA
jgi:glutamate synthase domain-containing protein 3